MIVVIKNKQYSNPDFRVNNGVVELRIASEQSFSEIVDDFALTEGETIIQLNDNEEQIGVFYVQGMSGIQLPDDDGGNIVTIKYIVSQLGKEAQEALNDDLDMATMSLLELAGIVAKAKTDFSDAATRLESSLTEQDSRITTVQATLNTINSRIAGYETLFNALADRVARLENAQ